MDESDHFIREFVKTRTRDRLSKVKLKKVVSDILLAQRVRRFLVGLQNDSKQTTSRLKPNIFKRRLSVRVVSPRGIRSPKHNVSHTKTINQLSLSMPEIKAPVLSASGRSERASRPDSKTPIPTIVLTSAQKSRPEKTIYPCLLNRGNGGAAFKDVSQKTHSAKMPRIETKSANGKVRTSPSKENKNPLIRLAQSDKHQGKNCASKPQTSLPALTDTLWAGDPKAIGSVRRPRKNAREMIASYKSGEDTRRLFRQLTFNVPCTRNCQKPDFFSEIERMYTELPSLLPAVEKAREDMATVNEDYSANLKARERRQSLLSYHSQSTSRRNSIAASVVSGRGNAVHLQPKTERRHGTFGFGFRH